MTAKKEARKSADIALLNMKGLTITMPAPYCTIEEWAERTGMTIRSIDEKMKKGHIAYVQHVPRGDRYVNVIAELSKSLEIRPW